MPYQVHLPNCYIHNFMNKVRLNGWKQNVVQLKNIFNTEGMSDEDESKAINSLHRKIVVQLEEFKGDESTIVKVPDNSSVCKMDMIFRGLFCKWLELQSSSDPKQVHQDIFDLFETTRKVRDLDFCWELKGHKASFEKEKLIERISLITPKELSDQLRYSNETPESSTIPEKIPESILKEPVDLKNDSSIPRETLEKPSPIGQKLTNNNQPAVTNKPMELIDFERVEKDVSKAETDYLPVKILCEGRWFSISKELEKICKNDFLAKTIKEYVKVFPATYEDHLSIIKYCENNMIHIQGTVAKPLVDNYVIKGIELNANDDDVKNSLVELDFEVISVQQLKRKKDGRKLPIWKISMPKSEKSDNFLELVSLNHLVVQVEKFKTSNVRSRQHKKRKFFNKNKIVNPTAVEDDDSSDKTKLQSSKAYAKKFGKAKDRTVYSKKSDEDPQWQKIVNNQNQVCEKLQAKLQKALSSAFNELCLDLSFKERPVTEKDFVLVNDKSRTLRS